MQCSPREFCARIGIQRPVLNAPMRSWSDAVMATAVCRAGGLGVLAGQRLTGAELLEGVRKIRDETDRPFAVALEIPPRTPMNLSAVRRTVEMMSAVLDELGLPADPAYYETRLPTSPERFDEQFEALLEARPAAAIALCGGWREIYGEALEARGIRLLGAATTLREAKVQRSSGVEAVICQGSEAGGPRENFEDDARAMTGLCSLVPQAARATRLPIIAAGGIASPEQAMGLACMGASAVMLGTALAATEESLAPDAYRDRVRYASPSDSVLTDLFSGRTARILRSPLYDALREAGSTALGGYPLPAAVFEPLLAAAESCGRSDLSAWPAGQSVGQSAWRRTADAVEAIGSAMIGLG